MREESRELQKRCAINMDALQSVCSGRAGASASWLMLSEVVLFRALKGRLGDFARPEGRGTYNNARSAGPAVVPCDCRNAAYTVSDHQPRERSISAKAASRESAGR